MQWITLNRDGLFHLHREYDVIPIGDHFAARFTGRVDTRILPFNSSFAVNSWELQVPVEFSRVFRTSTLLNFESCARRVERYFRDHLNRFRIQIFRSSHIETRSYSWFTPLLETTCHVDF